MADEEQPRLRDYIDGWADELIEQIEASLAKHAEFERLYPAPLEVDENSTVT